MIVKLYDNKGNVREVLEVSRAVIMDNVAQPLALYDEKSSTIVSSTIGDKDFENLVSSLGLYKPVRLLVKELKGNKNG